MIQNRQTAAVFQLILHKWRTAPTLLITGHEIGSFWSAHVETVHHGVEELVLGGFSWVSRFELVVLTGSVDGYVLHLDFISVR